MTDLVHTLSGESMLGPLQLRVTYPVQCRLGMRTMVNVGGTNEERAIVARHTATAIVLRQGLQHRHEIKERVVHVPLQHEEGETTGVTSKIMHELPEPVDQETVEHEAALSREAGSVSAT